MFYFYNSHGRSLETQVPIKYLRTIPTFLYLDYLSFTSTTSGHLGFLRLIYRLTPALPLTPVFLDTLDVSVAFTPTGAPTTLGPWTRVGTTETTLAATDDVGSVGDDYDWDGPLTSTCLFKEEGRKVRGRSQRDCLDVIFGRPFRQTF